MTQTNHNSEKRKHQRIAKNLPLKIKSGEFDIVTETKNVSCTGAYCQIDRYLAPFTKVKTTILLSSDSGPRSISCKGVVVRVEKTANALESQYNIAIYFNEISKANMSRINHFVKEHAHI